jgi:hypothetical protein
MAARRGTGRDRRRFPRHHLSVGIAYRIVRLPSPGRMIRLLDRMRRAKAENVSRGGMCFDAPQLLLPGTRLDLTVPKSPVTKRGTLRATVVWVRELAAGGFQVGVRFG